MEGRNQSTSSFTSDLFGSKESSASSTSSGIFGSIFAPSPKVLGRESLRRELDDKKQDPACPAWSTKVGSSEHIPPGTGVGENASNPNKVGSSFYQEEKVQPCHLSSSIYYGGQDVYSQPQNTTHSSGNTTFSKDGGGEEDDSGSASRGNWWQGSLYY